MPLPSASRARLDPDPGAMTLRGRCIGGGRMKLTVRGLDSDGEYPVEVDVRNVPVGSTWRGSVSALENDGMDQDRDRFRGIVAADGTWSYATALEPQGPQTIFDLTAGSAGSDRECFALAYPLERFQGGLVVCRPRLISAITLRQRADGDLAVRLLALPFRSNAGGERWRVTFRVSGAGGSQEVVVQDRASDEGSSTPPRG